MTISVPDSTSMPDFVAGIYQNQIHDSKMARDLLLRIRLELTLISTHLYLVKEFQAYRERRMKNNESARKSRELRRQKEESTQLRCDQLLQENHLLRAELSLLRNQMEQFRQVFSISSNNSQQNFIPSSSVPGL